MTDCVCNHFPLSGGNVTFDAGVSVGVGRGSPAYPLDVAGSLRYSKVNSGLGGLVDDDNHAIRANGHGAQVFANNWNIPAQGWIFRDEANGVDRVVIQGNGLVGIGTTSPQHAGRERDHPQRDGDHLGRDHHPPASRGRRPQGFVGDEAGRRRERLLLRQLGTGRPRGRAPRSHLARQC